MSIGAVNAPSAEAPSAEEAFNRSFRMSYARLVAELCIVTTSQVEAEEAVQEAFGRLWEYWEQVGAYENLEAWVRRVAINVAIGTWRRKRPTRPWTGTDLPAGCDPADGVLSVLSVLGGLSTNQRVALLLHHVVGLSVAEVAEEMSTKAGTVKSWLSRGRTELHHLLREGI